MAGAPQTPTRFVDDLSVRETFADSMGITYFDGAQFRAEFCVTRPDRPVEGGSMSQAEVPVCRLVLSIQAVEQLHHHLSRLAATLQAQRAQGGPAPQTVQ